MEQSRLRLRSAYRKHAFNEIQIVAFVKVALVFVAFVAVANVFVASVPW